MSRIAYVNGQYRDLRDASVNIEDRGYQFADGVYEVCEVRGGKLVTMPWPALAGANAKDGVPFAFKFFQQGRGSFLLPKGFVPNRIAVTLHPDGGSDVTRKLDWSEALAGRHGIAITTP